MELVLVMMIGFFVLTGRSNGSRADLRLVEVMLAAVFLMMALGLSAG